MEFVRTRRLALCRRVLFGLTGMVLMALATQSIWAGEAAKEPTVKELADKLAAQARNIDTVWTLVTAFLVFWMQAGFAYVEGGLTRAKNQNNIMMKNLLDFCFGTVAFWAVGFGLMFGAGNAILGTTGFFCNPGADEKATFAGIAWANVPLFAKFMFQLVFAATAATIVSGAMAERTKFSAYLIYSVFISAVIYPISGHWIWGGGWLSTLKPAAFWDFAGSTVVHSVGGWVALVGAAMLGPRIGKYGKDGKTNPIPGHSLPMAALGVFILWLGWFGFNPGSTMAGTVDTIAHIAAATNMAAATGCIAAMLAAWVLFKKPDISMALNGALAGLVAITCPCPWVSVGSAALIGIAAGVLVVFAVLFFDRIHVDDPVGAISVHAVCGVFGTLSLGLFSEADKFGTTGPLPGLFFGGGVSQLTAQVIGAAVVMAWATGASYVLFAAIRAINGLRVSAEEEIEGLDVGEHGSSAYPNFVVVEHGAIPSLSGSGGSAHAPAHAPRPATAPQPALES